jgi:hypothetical protein
MAKQLITASLVAPAFLGLNTQESSVANNPSFALEANNCIIDQFGRLGSRKGWFYRTSGSDGVNLLGMHPFLDVTGINKFISWSEDTFKKGFTTLSTITPTTSDTIAAGNWDAVTLNDRAYFFQGGYKPLYYTNESTTDEFKSIDNHADYTGTAPTANIVMSAYGRLWAADTSTSKTTVYFSDLLDGVKWGSGSAGLLNINGVLPKGADVITGLGSHNGFLIIFCKNNIIIFKDNDSFQGSFDVNTLTLVEVLEGVGCIARDSIQNTGDDIVFLSATGLRGLGRTIQEKSAKMNDLSRNIRDTFIGDVSRESNLGLIKSCYFPEGAFYLISLPEAKKVYIYDTKQRLEDGSMRITTWNDLDHADYVYDKTNKEMYVAQANGIAEYGQYTDNGSAYTMSYFTNHFDLELPNTNKLLKRVAVTAIGSTAQSFVVKAGFDYTTLYYSFPFTIKEIPTFEYGIGEYGANADVVSEYVGGIALDRLDASVQGSGAIVQLGIEATIDGGALSIQKLDVYGKQGRII